MDSKSQPTAGDAKFVNDLFRQLQAIFPAWRNAFVSDADVAEAKRQWTIGLVESRITSTEVINAGLRKARKSKNPFLPSVGMFLEWCSEAARERVNFPSIESVMLQITRYSHHRKYPAFGSYAAPEIDPVAYWVYQHVDMYAVGRSDEREAKRLVEIAYAEASEKAAQGFMFPDSPCLLTESVETKHEQTAEQRDQARSAITGMKSLFGGAA